MDGEYVYLVDPLCTMVVVCLIMSAAVPLIKQAMNILLDRSPAHVHMDQIRKELSGIRGVLNMHELHVKSPFLFILS